MTISQTGSSCSTSCSLNLQRSSKLLCAVQGDDKDYDDDDYADNDDDDNDEDADNDDADNDEDDDSDDDNLVSQLVS